MVCQGSGDEERLAQMSGAFTKAYLFRRSSIAGISRAFEDATIYRSQKK
jgi:hypothetical protein